MEIVLKYVVVLVITVAFKWIFAAGFHFGLLQIYEGKSEDSALQVYNLLKYFSRILIFIFFIVIFIWDFIAFGTMNGWQQLIMVIFFLFLFGYFKSCIGLLSHFINLLYFKELVDDIEWEGVFGEIKKNDDNLYLIHESSKTKLDITHLI